MQIYQTKKCLYCYSTTKEKCTALFTFIKTTENAFAKRVNKSSQQYKYHDDFFKHTQILR